MVSDPSWVFNKEKVGKGILGTKTNLSKSTEPWKFILTRNNDKDHLEVT